MYVYTEPDRTEVNVSLWVNANKELLDYDKCLPIIVNYNDDEIPKIFLLYILLQEYEGIFVCFYYYYYKQGISLIRNSTSDIFQYYAM